MDALNLARSFENRIGGKSTVQRWATLIRARLEKDGASERHRKLNRAMRDHIEQRFGQRGIDRDETPLSASTPMDSIGDEGSVPESIRFDRLERVDQSLRDAPNCIDAAELNAYVQGLRWLASIKTGKKGTKDSGLFRHPLKEVHPGIWLPRPLAAGSATEAAIALCGWLESLRTDRPEDFSWFLTKWVHASEHERGRIRLDSADEVERARALDDTQLVAVRIDGAIVATRRVRPTTNEVPRMRIKCRDADGHVITRDTQAVRWVLSYVAAFDFARQAGCTIS